MVAGVVPVLSPVNEHNSGYLHAKVKKDGHMLQLPEEQKEQKKELIDSLLTSPYAPAVNQVRKK